MSGAPNLQWDLAPTVLVPLALYAALYFWRFRLARQEEGGKGASGWQLAAFGGALVLLLVALVSPLDGLGDDYLFSAHMVQHLLIGDLAPLLVLLSLSRVMLRPATRRLLAVERALGRFAHPLTGLLLWVGLIWLWHIPAFYDAALEHPALHVFEHMCFFTAGICFWWPLVQPLPMRHGLTGLGSGAYIGAGKLALGALAIVLIFSPTVLYSYYEHVPRIWGLTASQDQAVGGVIMMLEQSFVLVTAFVVLFLRMLDQSERDEQRRERFGADAAA